MRRFKSGHQEGFRDGTEFIDVLDNGEVVLQDKSGRRGPSGFLTEEILDKWLKYHDLIEVIIDPALVAPA